MALPGNPLERSQSVDIDDRLREGPRCFLRKLMSDAVFERLATLWPERRQNIGRARTPVKTARDCRWDFQRLHEDGGYRQPRPIADHCEQSHWKENGAPYSRADRERSRGNPAMRAGEQRQQSCGCHKARQTVENRNTLGRASLCMSDIQHAGTDLLRRTESCVGLALERSLSRQPCLVGLRHGEVGRPQGKSADR